MKWRNKAIIIYLLPLLLGFPAQPATYREQKIIEDFPKAFAKQEKSQWCWAACVEMVLRSRGVNISQTEIVKENYGTIVDLPAGLDRIQKSLNLKKDGKSVLMKTEVTNALGDIDAVEKIDRGDVIIAAISDSIGQSAHHVVIVYGYGIDTDNKIWLDIFDPWPGKGATIINYSEEFFWQKTILATFPEEVSSPSEINPNAEKRLVRDSYADDQIQWITTYPERMVRYKYGYTNQDPTRSLRFKLLLRAGTTPRDKTKSDWVPHTTKEVIVELPPLGTTNVQGSLEWFGATATRMPRFTHTITYCQFVGTNTEPDQTFFGPAAFSSFAGFRRGQTEKDIIALLGKPSSRTVDSSTIDLGYFYDELQFSCDKKNNRIEVIAINGIRAVKGLRQRGVKDDKLILYNETPEGIVKAMGKCRMHSSFYDYEYKGVDNGLDVSFFIDKNGPTQNCSSISLQWFF